MIGKQIAISLSRGTKTLYYTMTTLIDIMFDSAIYEGQAVSGSRPLNEFYNSAAKRTIQSVPEITAVMV